MAAAHPPSKPFPFPSRTRLIQSSRCWQESSGVTAAVESSGGQRSPAWHPQRTHQGQPVLLTSLLTELPDERRWQTPSSCCRTRTSRRQPQRELQNPGGPRRCRREEAGVSRMQPSPRNVPSAQEQLGARGAAPLGVAQPGQRRCLGAGT